MTYEWLCFEGKRLWLASHLWSSLVSFYFPSAHRPSTILQAVSTPSPAPSPLFSSLEMQNHSSRYVSSTIQHLSMPTVTHKHLRVVDKFSVAPATTCVYLYPRVSLAHNILFRYIGAEFPKIIDNPLVEYRQANLTVPCLFDVHPFNFAGSFSIPSGRCFVFRSSWRAGSLRLCIRLYRRDSRW